MIDNVVIEKINSGREFAERFAHSLGGFATDDPGAEVGLIHNDGRYYRGPEEERLQRKEDEGYFCLML